MERYEKTEALAAEQLDCPAPSSCLAGSPLGFTVRGQVAGSAQGLRGDRAHRSGSDPIACGARAGK